jgi:hypothetical protein
MSDCSEKYFQVILADGYRIIIEQLSALSQSTPRGRGTLVHYRLNRLGFSLIITWANLILNE